MMTSQADPDDDTACCPDCGAEVYLHAVRCAACGSYMTPTLRGSGRGLLLAVIALITLGAFLCLVFFR